MGMHAGVFFFDGRPAAHMCGALRLGLQPFAPDGVSVHAEHGVAMAHGAFHVWEGDRSCEQPWRSPAGFVVTWDGRLDNRDDLLLRLGERLGDGMSDARIALSAFERWGIDGLRLLIGDWSVAIWDRNRRVLHLARDYMGIRPLYYCATEHALMWSSSLGELARRAHRIDALDEEFIARFVALRFSAEVTPYVGIRAVPTASCITFSSSASQSRRRFWQFDPGTVRFRDRREYEERLRELWADAVGTRLRTPDPVWAELSGGFDSSSVVCMADRLLRSSRVAARELHLVSHATLRSPEGDERRFIAAVEAQVGGCSEIVGVEDHIDDVDPEWSWVTPFALQGVGLACVRRVRAHGGRLILSGRAGDAVMGAQPDNSPAVFDDLQKWRVFSALAGMRAWSRSTRKPLVEIGSNLLLTLLRQHPRLHLPAKDELRRTGISLLTPRVRSMLDDVDARHSTSHAHVRASKREMLTMLLGYSFCSRFDVPTQPPGVVYTYPFVHRPLVEFMLAIPGEELSGPGDTRSLMRRAFDGVVPARILRRTSKGYYPPSAMRAVRQAAAAAVSMEALEVVQRGWVDPDRLAGAVRVLRDGSGSRGTEVRQILDLEKWLAIRNRRAPADIPQRKEVNSYGVLNA